jgi:uncharacterized protein (DUF4213/DUF364 family)
MKHMVENGNGISKLLEDIKQKAWFRLQHRLDLLEETLLAEPLGVAEALGDPAPYKDFALQRGEEKLMEVTIRGAIGQAFTSNPSRWRGKLREIFELNLTLEKNRALFVASINAAGRLLQWGNNTIHCKDQEPDRCAYRMAEFVAAKLEPTGCVGIVGYQPAIVKHMVDLLGSYRVRVTDLNPKNIGKDNFNVTILDGSSSIQRLAQECRIGLVTGSTLINGTLDSILSLFKDNGVESYLYGTTAAIPAALLGLERLCFEAK